MSWVALLEVVDGLHRIGMSVPIAMEEHARSGVGAGRDAAAAWLSARLRLGDPIEAMRSVAGELRDPTERFAAECLQICLERSGADHHRTLRVAREQLRLDRGRPETLSFALALVALTSGEAGGRAIERTTTAFGERRTDAVRSLLVRSTDGAVPPVQSLRHALREMRATRRTVPWRGAAASAFALTAAVAGSLPSSVELGLVGW
jgi:hypothetical protein